MGNRALETRTLSAEQFNRCIQLCVALDNNPPKVTGRLRTIKGRCCLGVACDVHDSSKWLPPEYEERGYAYGDWAETLTAPADVVDYYGFTDVEGFYIPTHIVEQYVTVPKYLHGRDISMAIINDELSPNHAMTARMLRDYLFSYYVVIQQ